MRWRWNVRRNQRKVHLWSSFETRRNLQAEARYGHAFQTALFQTVERSEKVHATIPKAFVWFCVQSSSSRNFWRMVRETIEACFLPVCREQCIDHIPYCLSGLSRPHFFRQPSSKVKVINMRYWPSVRSRWLGFGQVLFCVLFTETKWRSIKNAKKKTPIYSHLDRTSLVNNLPSEKNKNKHRK